jgi:hypothetical protein
LITAPLVAFFLIRATAPAAADAPPPPAQATARDQPCLSQAIYRFLAAMLAGKPKSVPLATDAEVRENTRSVPLTATAWRDLKAVRSVMTFADPVTGNVVWRAGAELRDGKPGYISARLEKIGDGRILDVELSSDTSARVVKDYVWNLDPQLTAVVPPEQRLDRVALEALARRYFHSLSSHQAVAADFDERCDRFHSGQRITNVARNTAESGPPRTCASSLEGNPPWGPATERRFPVIDPQPRHRLRRGLAALPEASKPAPDVRLGGLQGGRREDRADRQHRPDAAGGGHPRLHALREPEARTRARLHSTA